MSISVIALALAAQGGQEITTFHPLPSQRKEAQAQQEASGQPAGAAPQSAKAAPAAPAEPEVIEVLSVREIPANASVRFVPPDEPQ